MTNILIKKKILFITFGRSSVPSVNFRLMIHREILGCYFDIEFSENFSSLWHKLFIQPDVIFIQKKQLPFFYWLLIKLFFRSKVIYDFDDAIYLSPGKNWSYITRLKVKCRFRLVCKLANLILCPNTYLAKEANKFNHNVRILPMCAPLAKSNAVITEPIIYGWAGHPQSIHLLKTIEIDINKFQIISNNRNFLILCGEDPKMNFSYEWLPYSLDNQHLFFSKVNVGLAPSRNTPFDQGKSPIKIIQHFSYGQTVLTNMSGGAEDIVNDGNGFIVDESIGQSWVNQLVAIANNPKLVRSKSDAALKDFQTYFDSQVIGKKFVDLIKSILV
jgi:hypothetical protein